MNLNLIKKEVKNNYPDLHISRVYLLKGLGVMNGIFIAEDISGRKYVIKIYKNNNYKKIRSEHVVLSLMNDRFLKGLSYIKNKKGKTYTFSQSLGKYLGAYDYKKGETTTLNPSLLGEIAFSLATLHKISSRLSGKREGVLSRDPRKELIDNLDKLKKSLQLLDGRSQLSKKEKVVKKVIILKLEQIKKYDLTDDLELISRASRGIIHGDFFLPNLVVADSEITSVLDWENACNYIYIWEIFRSALNSSKIGRKGIICSKIDIARFKRFIDLYKNAKLVREIDLRGLKLMPKYYYLLDSYVVTSYVLDNNIKLAGLISSNVDDHFWLETNHQAIVDAL